MNLREQASAMLQTVIGPTTRELAAHLQTEDVAVHVVTVLVLVERRTNATSVSVASTATTKDGQAAHALTEAILENAKEGIAARPPTMTITTTACDCEACRQVVN